MSSGEGGSVDPGWRSGRSPATRDRLRECNVPHTVPLCNTNNVICPTRLESGHPSDPKWACLRRLRGLGGFMRGTGAPAGPVALSLFARRLAGYRGTDVALWDRVGYARISPHSHRKDPPPMLRAASLAALSLLAALVVACGGGAASGEADPASAVPGDAMFYSEVAIKPE